MPAPLTARRLPQDPAWATRIELDSHDATRYYTSAERTVADVTLRLAGCTDTAGQALKAGLQLVGSGDEYLTPQQAREVARHLLELAEAAERG
jgi:hypothetical protein